jgi:hypothetical protein
MVGHSKFGTRVIRLMAYPLSTFALCALVASNTRAQTAQPWTITVDVTQASGGNGNTPHITSNNNPPPTDCGAFESPQTPKDGDLYVCPDNTVTWSVKTEQGHGELAIWDQDGVVLAQGSSKPHWFHGSPTQDITGTVEGSPGTHTYLIAVYDPDGKNGKFKLYLYDPQIVIGGGTEGGKHKKKNSGQK